MTDDELEAQIRRWIERGKDDDDNGFLLRRLDEARTEIANLQADAANDAAEVLSLREEIAYLRGAIQSTPASPEQS